MPLFKQSNLAEPTGYNTNNQAQNPTRANELDPTKSNVTIIGLYGISGSGKTFLLDRLKEDLPGNSFQFYEGSEMIANLVPGGLQAFQTMNAQDKTHWRELAIDTIRSQCRKGGATGVVTGHFMFWKEAEEEGSTVCTQRDLATYTHILYLDIPIETIEQRRWNDASKPRPHTSVAHLYKWQQAEKIQLQTLCREHGILFSVLTSNFTVKSRALALLRDFSVHTKEHNEVQAQIKLDAVVAAYRRSPETFLVFDGDRTLAAQDTGSRFWETLSDSRGMAYDDPLKSLFGGPLKYTYQAFRQAILLYEDAVDEEHFEKLCRQVASEVTIRPEFSTLLHLVARQEHIGIVVVSCGLRRVWELVLERGGFTNAAVIAGGRISDGFVVTAETKAAIVARLQTLHRGYVWAFGDSPLDIPMLQRADEAVVVVGNEPNRSKTMDPALLGAIDRDGLRACQIRMPVTAPPRLSKGKLPLADLNDMAFISSLLCRRDNTDRFPIYHATNKSAAKLLATPMRDAAVAGPALRKAHSEAGLYLAREFVADIIGMQKCPISHVLGIEATGSMLLHEQTTTVIAVMRAGEPMASGVSKAFPLAMYVHAHEPTDLVLHHIKDQHQVILVDSVINSGKTVVEFVQRIRDLANVRIVVVAGVVQGECVSPNSAVYKALADFENVSLVALRISSTKFTGSGTTDTGNRLFNTTHLKR